MVSADRQYVVIVLVAGRVPVEQDDDECPGAAMAHLGHQREQTIGAVRIPLHLPQVREESSRGCGPQAAVVSCVKVRTLSRRQQLKRMLKASITHPNTQPRSPSPPQ